MFSVAMRSAAESQRETRATFIAQSLFSDLESGASPSNAFVAIGTNLPLPAARQGVNLRTPGTNYIAFSEEGLPVGTLSAAAFSNPFSQSNSTYGAAVIILPNPVFSNLTRVEVQVEAPTSAAQSARAKYNFVTSLRNQ